jgi:hypothetical protein
MELEDPLWPTRALLNDDEERAAALSDALLREPDVELTTAGGEGRLLVVAASAAAAALVGHCLCAQATATSAGRVAFPTLPTPRMPTGEAGAAGGGRRKPSGAAGDDEEEEKEEGGAAAAAAAAAASARDQDPSSLPVPDYCRGCESPLLACDGALVAVATPALPGSAAAAAIAAAAGAASAAAAAAAPVPDARAGSWARGVLDKLRPSRVLVVAEAQGEQYRGEGDPSEDLLAFSLRTTTATVEEGAEAPPPPLPAGTVVGGLAAALVAECELAGIPAMAVIAVEMVPALTAAHAPALGRAAAAAARALAAGGGGDDDKGAAAAAAAVAARLEAAPALHAARHDMERAMPAGGVYT